MITRTIERGSGRQVALSIRRLGMPEELITRAFEANERIIAELGGIDGETLRNSYLIEQKGLNRLESVHRSGRETTVRKLLGLEKLLRLTEHFTLTESDEQQRAWSIERLKLAEIQSRIPQLSEQLGQIETSLDAVMISENLTIVGQLRAEIAEQELSLALLTGKRAELKSRKARILQLKKADTILADIINAYD